MRNSFSENPYIWVKFNTGDNPTITIYKSSDSSVVVNAVLMSELATTGYFNYQFVHGVSTMTDYFYIANTTNEEVSGALTIGGYPNDILEDSNELQLNQNNWLTADISSIPTNPLLTNDTRLNNLDATISSRANLNPPSQNLDDYKANISSLATLENQVIRSFNVVDISPTNVSFVSDLTETTNKYWERGAVKFTSGQNEGIIRKIQQYDGSTNKITLRTQLPYIPANGDSLIIIPLRCFRTNFDDVVKIVNDIENSIIEGSLTNIQMKRIMFSALAGLCSGGGTSNIKFRDFLDTKARIDVTVNTVGDRLTISFDGS